MASFRKLAFFVSVCLVSSCNVSAEDRPDTAGQKTWLHWDKKAQSHVEMSRYESSIYEEIISPSGAFCVAMGGGKYGAIHCDFSKVNIPGDKEVKADATAQPPT